jgi:type I restriction enzyme M protein
MAKKKTKQMDLLEIEKPASTDLLEIEKPTSVDDEVADVIPEGYVPDYISGSKNVKETPKELVRQRIARALLHEYLISNDDMAADFPASIGGKRKKLDIAIFRHNSEHTPENLSRIVVCRPEPKLGRNVIRLRDYDQADKDLEELKELMEGLENCEYGLWTNGLEFFYLKKITKRFEIEFEPIGDWPLSEESQGTQEVFSQAKTRKADGEMLTITFRRCHNFIHGNEGMPKDAAFWQFLYLIFCKLHDERSPRQRRRFWAGPKEQFSEEGRQAIRQRVMPLFTEVKKRYEKSIFNGNEEITLSDRALAFMVSELARYELSRTDVDVKGAAYQEIVGTNLRGDRGQYFTPRSVIELTVAMLDPKEHERVLDPACGTGGFLVETLGYMLREFRKRRNGRPDDESTQEFHDINEELREFAEKQLFGSDFDPFLIRATQMNMVMAGNANGHLYHINSLEFPGGYLGGLDDAKKEISLGSMDVVMTNPPFGSDIPITEEKILEQYELAKNWEKTEDGNYRRTGSRKSSVAPEILFVERCIKWLKPGGRAGIVLPDGILGNPAAEYIRWWILHHTWVLASVDLPVEAFIYEANVNILTSVLFVKRKTEEEMRAEVMGGKKDKDYPVFMAVAEKVGIDRRGNKLYKRTPDGEEIIKVVDEIEKVRVGDRMIERRLKRRDKIDDNDLPKIVEAYREFRREYPEPGQ